MESGFTSKGNELKVYEQFTFRKIRYLSSTEEELWRCTQKICNTKLYTKHDGHVLSRVEGVHNHEPVDVDKLNRQAICNSLKIKAAETDEKPSKVIQLEVEQRGQSIDTLTKDDIRLIRTNLSRYKLQNEGEQCKKRWRNIRDNFMRQKKEESTGVGKAPKKRRANYWDMLSFLDGVEDDRQGFTIADAESDSNAETVQPNADSAEAAEYAGCEIENCYSFQMVDNGRDFGEQPIKQEPTVDHPTVDSGRPANAPSTTTKQKVMTDILKNRMEGEAKFIKCIEKLICPDPVEEVDLFFKAMAATVKKFTPQQIAQVKVDIFNIVSNVEMNNCS